MESYVGFNERIEQRFGEFLRCLAFVRVSSDYGKVDFALLSTSSKKLGDRFHMRGRRADSVTVGDHREWRLRGPSFGGKQQVAGGRALRTDKLETVFFSNSCDLGLLNN
eukprot:183896_1